MKFASSFLNSETDETFDLISVINMPFQHHYNVLLKDPFFTFQKRSEGYYLHDGLVENGRIRQISQDEIDKLRPYMIIYKKRS